jgi:branched-chain amino acid transport system substrate-binding protein
MNMVANAPGKKIGPGELSKALKIIAAGGDVDYQGATNVEFNDVGEVYGSYKELEVDAGKWNTIKVH